MAGEVGPAVHEGPHQPAVGRPVPPQAGRRGAQVPVEGLLAGAGSLTSSHLDAPYTATTHQLPAAGSTDTLAITCDASDIGVALTAVDAQGGMTDEVRVAGASAQLNSVDESEINANKGSDPMATALAAIASGGIRLKKVSRDSRV